MYSVGPWDRKNLSIKSLWAKLVQNLAVLPYFVPCYITLSTSFGGVLKVKNYYSAAGRVLEEKEVCT